jgi:cytoskeletal protein RodZ
MSIALLAARTRVQPRILTAIELNDLDGIPPKPYGRGFVRAYAQELGLDPERVVHDYFGQFPAAAAPAAPPRVAADTTERHGIAALIPAAITILIGIGIVALLWQNAHSVDAPALAPAVGTTGVAPVPAAAPVTKDPAHASPAPPAPDHLTLVIRASRDCWVTASADGQRVVYQLLAAGAERSLTGSREIVLRAGDAGALRLIVNGRDAGLFGQSGEVRQARITPGNAAAFGSASGR